VLFSECNLVCDDIDNFIKTLPSNFVQLIVTSPPYNIGKSYESRTGLKDYLEQQSNIITELVRVLTDGGSICWQVGNYVEKGEVFPLDIYFYDIFKKQGLQLRNRIIWHFGHGLHCTKRFSGRYETILWFTKGEKYLFNLDSVRVPSKYPNKKYYKGPNKGKLSGNPLGKNPSDVWEFVQQEWNNAIWEIPNVKHNHPEKTTHPCQFPVELVERCILAHTKIDDWVFDPYAGVGSSMLAAVKHGRKFIGCEKEKQYVEIAYKRLDDLRNGKLKTREIGTPIYQTKPNS
jgi:adenine-specific DNA-methyltransferase